MAQAIKCLWMREGERFDPDCQRYNRYGVQLGIKVPLWGGFTGRGRFALRLWTPRPKMSMEEWAARVPQLKRAADAGNGARRNVRAKAWQDGEKFLQQSDIYKDDPDFWTISGDCLVRYIMTPRTSMFFPTEENMFITDIFLLFYFNASSSGLK